MLPLLKDKRKICNTNEISYTLLETCCFFNFWISFADIKSTFSVSNAPGRILLFFFVLTGVFESATQYILPSCLFCHFSNISFSDERHLNILQPADFFLICLCFCVIKVWAKTPGRSFFWYNWFFCEFPSWFWERVPKFDTMKPMLIPADCY